MSRRRLRSHELSPLELAAENLQKLNWDLPPWVVTKDHENECARYLLGVANERYGRNLSELEERFERSRWLRSQAMMAHLERFKELSNLCFKFLFKLTDIDAQPRLGTRAGLHKASSQERPSSWIQFKPEFPPEAPPLDIFEYEKLMGGPHVFGSRLLWWCAAAETPKEFGYASDLSVKIWTQPFWFSEIGNRKLRVNQRPMALLQEAATYCVQNNANSETDEAAHKDGPGPASTFYWKGKQISLQPMQGYLAKFLWNIPGKPWEVEEVVEEVWGGEATDSAISTCVSRLNARFLEANIPIIVTRKESRLKLEIHGKD